MISRRMVAAWILVGLAAVTAMASARFMSWPDVQGDRVVFAYEGDLWLANLSGGLAWRLTSHPGEETMPRFSPDGRWIAFTGEYEAGPNAYLIPAEGGAPRRLTFRPGAEVVGWTPDGAQVIFRAAWEHSFRPVTRLYQVGVNGDMPVALPMPRAVLADFSPDGQRIAYNPLGREEYNWKRYQGGQHLTLWLHDTGDGSYRKLSEHPGKNAYPMWLGETLYFASEQGEGGVVNLFRHDFNTGKPVQVTRYTDFDVQMPATDGRRIVFVQAGYLQVWDQAASAPRRIEVQTPSDHWRMAKRIINPKEYVHSMAISNDGRTAALEARGDLFLVPADANDPTVNLTRSPGTRERFPQISPDGETLAFFSDRTGEYRLYTLSLKNPAAEWTSLSNDLKTTVYHLEWSPDGRKILFGTKDLDIFYMDVESRKLVRVDHSDRLKNDEFTWEISDYAWSPDSQWIAYSRVEPNRNNRVFLYSLADGNSHPVTDGFYDSLNPAFDSRGEFLYFLSYRNFDVEMDIFEDNHIISRPVQVMALQLRAGEPPPFARKVAGEDGPDNGKKKHPEEKEPAPAAFRIDLANLADRLFTVPVEPGRYFHLRAGSGKVMWASSEHFAEDELEEIFDPGDRTKWKIHVFDPASQKETPLDEPVTSWRLSPDGARLILRKSREYFLTSLDELHGGKKPGRKLDLGRLAYLVDPAAEAGQIFNDVWRWYRDFFYDPDMHGHDWQAVGEKYRQLLPGLQSRSQLNWLLLQMVGELCVSHTYIGGGDTDQLRGKGSEAFTGLLGADFEADPSGCYRFKSIYGPTPYNREIEAPLVKPDLPLKEGDFLIAIDGHPVRVPESPYRFLQVLPGQKVELTVNSKPSADGAVRYLVTPVRSERALRYERWIAGNIRKVQESTGGEVGYLHLTAMGDNNLGQFDKYWRAFRHLPGLVIDVRGNGGGWVEYFVIDKLERQRIGYNCLQRMEPFPYPHPASTAKYTVISNEFNGSDGELFIEHFKARRLGTVVGVPSWGGLVGIINRQRTLDNGFVQQPNNAFYGREGKWFVENHGADPDILVENDPASVAAGQDHQLDKAIEVTLQEMKRAPFQLPEKPAYPRR